LFLEHPASSAGELTPATGKMSQPGPLPGVCSPDPQNGNQCDTWSATYSMAVMASLYYYYLYTGDLAFVQAHWQAVVRQMEWAAQQVDSNGLFAVSSADDADWNIEDLPGELTYVNAIYELALQSASKLASAVGKPEEARLWAAEAGAIKRAVNRELWDPKTSVYDASTTERGSVVQDANVTAILAGIPRAARAHEITDVLTKALRSPYGAWATSSPVPKGYTHDVSPYMGGFNVLADFVAGNGPAALALIRKEWGFMISHDPGGSDWERIEPNGVPAGGAVADSAAHAWSTGPVPALSEYVLGVAPTAPGFARWTAAPNPSGLSWTQGVVPTPRGPISVRWRRVKRGGFVLTVAAPRRAVGTVEIPLLGRARAIARDGRLVWNGHRALAGYRARRVGGSVAFPNTRGTNTYAW
jgi:alpha-L-rhamnosidase